MQNQQQAYQQILEAPKIIYKCQFQSKEEAKTELNNHPNYMNFITSSKNLNQQFIHYIQMLIGAAKVGLKAQIVDIFPKGCFGCFLVDLIKWSYVLKHQQQAIKLIKIVTDDWFYQQLFDIIIKKIKELFRHLGRNTSLNDRSQFCCLRFTQYKRQIYNYFQFLSSKFNNKKLNQVPKLSGYQFQNYLSKFKK